MGALPAEVQTYQTYGAAELTQSQSPEAAKTFIAYLAGATAKALFAASDVE